LLRIKIGSSYYDVAMIATTVYCVWLPISKFTVITNDLIYDLSPTIVQKHGGLGHLITTPLFEKRFWELLSLTPFRPTSIVAR